ncbi:MAG TPA: hypothetical protein VMH85_02960 [Terriglobales bacterium]|nr:hypothetical protein [Terriglobales bacterium]
MKRILAISVASLLAALALLYAGDYLSLRFRIPHHREQFGKITVYSYYAIAKKANKVEFDPAGTQDVTCVHSIFPHFGDNPCWYVSRHTEQRIDL